MDASPSYDQYGSGGIPFDAAPSDDALLREVRNFLASARAGGDSAMTTGSPRHVQIDPHVATLDGDVDWLDLPLGLGILLEAVNHESILYHYPERELDVLPPAAFAPTNAAQTAPEGEAAALVGAGSLADSGEPVVEDINEALRLQGPARMIKYVCTLTSTMHLLPEDHFERLYQTGVQSRAASRRLAQQMIAERAEAELRTCTFKPAVSKGASALPGYKGDLAEMYKVKVEWLEAREMKLERERKKMEAEEKQEIKDAQWKMNETSKQILEQAASRGVKLGGWEHLTQPRAAAAKIRETVLSSADQRSMSAVVPVDQHGAPFSPTTNYTQLRHVAQHMGAEGAGEDSFYNFTRLFDRPGLASEYMRDLRSETLDGGADASNEGGTGPRAPRFVTRMELDAVQRKERAKERALIYAERQREKLYDPVTGQPLFEPNAPPTLVRPDGTRVAYAEMTSPERVLLERRCRRVRVSPFLPDQLHGSVDGAEKRTPADHEGTVTRLLARQAEGRTHLERIRKSDERERSKLFKPELNPDSVKMLSGRVPVYEQPLPKKVPPPPPKPRPKADDRKVIRVAESNAEFAANQKASRQRLAEQLQRQRERDCCFRPALSEASRRLVEERNSRLRVELASWEPSSDVRTPPSARQLYDARALSASAAGWQSTELRPHLRQLGSPPSRHSRPGAQLMTPCAEPAIEDLVDGLLGGVPPTAAQRHLDPQRANLQRPEADPFRDIPTMVSARGASSGSYREVSGFEALMDEWRELDEITSQALALKP